MQLHNYQNVPSTRHLVLLFGVDDDFLPVRTGGRRKSTKTKIQKKLIYNIYVTVTAVSYKYISGCERENP